MSCLCLLLLRVFAVDARQSLGIEFELVVACIRINDRCAVVGFCEIHRAFWLCLGKNHSEPDSDETKRKLHGGRAETEFLQGDVRLRRELR